MWYKFELIANETWKSELFYHPTTLTAGRTEQRLKAQPSAVKKKQQQKPPKETNCPPLRGTSGGSWDDAQHSLIRQLIATAANLN